MSNRDRIDEIRLLLLDAFMADDNDIYSRCVVELEKLIGVEPGRRRMDTVPAEERARICGIARQARLAKKFKWGEHSLDAELEDGVLSYSIKYGGGDAE